MVGLSIAGTAMPMVTTMTMSPIIAQKRADNFGIAESAAVVYAAQHEGTSATPVAAGTCEPTLLTPGAWQVTCTYGKNDFQQSNTKYINVARMKFCPLKHNDYSHYVSEFYVKLRWLVKNTIIAGLP